MPHRFPESITRRYRIERILGQGGVGRVYLARDLELDQLVAIKVLLELEADEAERRRFLEEARVCAQLKHPNLVSVLRTELDDEEAYLVFEFIDGESLESRILRDGELEVSEALRVAAGILGGLDHAHRQGVLHRDLKPQNILLAKPDHRPCIVDFGLAKTPGRKGFRTKTGVVLGTPHYLAPELIRGTPASVASDLYSFGCLLHYCLTGAPPYQHDSLGQVLIMHQKHEPPQLLELRPGISPHISAVVMRLLAKAPADRLQSAAEVMEALNAPAALRKPISSRPRANRSGPAEQRAVRTVVESNRPAVVRAGVTVGSRPDPPRNRKHRMRLPLPGLLVLGAIAALLVAMVLGHQDHTIAAPPSQKSIPNTGDLATVSARALSEALAEFSVRSFIHSIVTDRNSFNTNLNYLQVELDPLKTSGVQDVHHAPRMQPTIKSQVEKSLDMHGIAARLEQFAPLASDFFSKATTGSELRRTLYEQLLNLHYIDFLCHTQLDDNIPGYDQYYHAAVREEKPEIPAPGITDKAPAVLLKTTHWVMEGFENDSNLQSWVETNSAYREAFNSGSIDYEVAKRRFTHEVRAKMPDLAGVKTDARLKLSAVVGWFATNALLEFTITGRRGEPELKLLLGHPGSLDWYLAMDGWKPARYFGFRTDTHATTAVPAMQGFVWGRLGVSFPAGWLPPHPMEIRIHYGTFPGVTPDQVSSLARASLTREITLSVQ